jgi:hypothetical protein
VQALRELHLIEQALRGGCVVPLATEILDQALNAGNLGNVVLSGTLPRNL